MTLNRAAAWGGSLALVLAGLNSVELVIVERLGSVEALQPWIAGVVLVLAFDAFERMARKR